MRLITNKMHPFYINLFLASFYLVFFIFIGSRKDGK